MMMQEKIEDFIKATFGAAVGAVLVIGCLCIAPFLLIWSVNTLADFGGAQFHIEHGIASYFTALVFLLLVRGGK